MNRNVFYQPIMTDTEFAQFGLNANACFLLFKNAQKAFAGYTIGAYTKDEIRNPIFSDDAEYLAEEKKQDELLEDAIGVLRQAESFIVGFEDDEMQEGVDELLEKIRAYTDN